MHACISMTPQEEDVMDESVPHDPAGAAGLRETGCPGQQAPRWRSDTKVQDWTVVPNGW